MAVRGEHGDATGRNREPADHPAGDPTERAFHTGPRIEEHDGAAPPARGDPAGGNVDGHPRDLHGRRDARHRLARRQVPQPGGPVDGGGDGPRPAEREVGAAEPAGVSGERRVAPAARRVPCAGGSVGGGGEHAEAVGAENRGDDRAAVTEDVAGGVGLSGQPVPLPPAQPRGAQVQQCAGVGGVAVPQPGLGRGEVAGVAVPLRPLALPVGVGLPRLGVGLGGHGAGGLAGRPHGLHGGGDGAQHERHQHGRGGGERHAVAGGELAEPVGAPLGPGLQRLAGEVAVDIGPERGDARVAAVAVGPRRPLRDPLQLAGEARPQRLGRGLPGRRDGRAVLGRERREAGGRRGRLGAVGVRRGRRRREPREQLAQDQPQAVDIGPHVEVAPAGGLLGAHRRPAARQLAGLGDLRFERAVAVDGLGDAEVDHLRRRPAVAVEGEHVGRLQVAVDQAALVGVGDAVAGAAEQPQALLDRQAAPVGEAGDGLAGHPLHDEVGPAVGRGARLEGGGDVGVLQERQRPPLAIETGDDCAGCPCPAG